MNRMHEASRVLTHLVCVASLFFCSRMSLAIELLPTNQSPAIVEDIPLIFNLSGAGSEPRRSIPRWTARCLMPSASSQLTRRRPHASFVVHDRNKSMTNRSNSAENRAYASAQGTFTVCVPCAAHSRRGTSATNQVRY